MVLASAYIVVQVETFPTIPTERTEHRFKYGFTMSLDEDSVIYGSKEEAEANCSAGWEAVPLSVAIQYMVDSAYVIK